jgi:hypothetical protein
MSFLLDGIGNNKKTVNGMGKRIKKDDKKKGQGGVHATGNRTADT